MAKTDLAGDRLKELEMAEAGRKLMPELPVIARLDGRAFHTLTRGMDRPFDHRFIGCMHATTKELVDEFRPAVGYTQSDEISLVWLRPIDFDGRIQKLCSILAASATSYFVRMFDIAFPDKRHLRPQFDCRVFSVPNLRTAVDVLQWREDDAVRNSVQMAAQAHFSHKQLQKKSTRELKTMLEEKGFVWGNMSDHLKRGAYFQRTTTKEPLSENVRMAIPERHRPAAGQLVERSKVEILAIPPLRKIKEWDLPSTLFGVDSW